MPRARWIASASGTGSPARRRAARDRRRGSRSRRSSRARDSATSTGARARDRERPRRGGTPARRGDGQVEPREQRLRFAPQRVGGGIPPRVVDVEDLDDVAEVGEELPPLRGRDVVHDGCREARAREILPHGRDRRRTRDRRRAHARDTDRRPRGRDDLARTQVARRDPDGDADDRGRPPGGDRFRGQSVLERDDREVGHGSAAAQRPPRDRGQRLLGILSLHGEHHGVAPGRFGLVDRPDDVDPHRLVASRRRTVTPRSRMTSSAAPRATSTAGSPAACHWADSRAPSAPAPTTSRRPVTRRSAARTRPRGRSRDGRPLRARAE